MFTKSSQRGNALFIILIAVALFAALSFAITRSSRTGGAPISEEKMSISWAKLQSRISMYRGAITRMTLAGTDISVMTAYDPSVGSPSFSSTSIYHPDGGGVPFDGNFLTFDEGGGDSSSGSGMFSIGSGIEIVNVGTSESGTGNGNDILAILLVRPALCEYINKKIGYGSSIPIIPGIFGSFIDIPYGATNPESEILGTGGLAGSSVLDGRTELCVSDGTYNMFYAVIAE